MTSRVEIDADRIAAAVRALPLIAGLHSGRFGEIVTYLPGRRIPGVRVRDRDITIGVTTRYPATIAQVDASVRAAVGPADRPVSIAILDIDIDAGIGTDRSAPASVPAKEKR